MSIIPIISFSFQGKFEREYKLNMNQTPVGIQTNNETIYVNKVSVNKDRDEYLLFSIALNGDNLSKWFSNSVYQKGYKSGLASNGCFYKTEKDLKYSNTFFDTIFSIKNNTVRPYILINTKNKVSIEDIREYNRCSDFFELKKKQFNSRKFKGINHYIESSNILMFQFVNDMLSYHLIYNTKSGETLGANRFVDDLTLRSEFGQKFYCTYKENFISCIQNTNDENMYSFIKNVKNNSVKTSTDEKEKICKLTSNSNPVLIFYQPRTKFETK